MDEPAAAAHPQMGVLHLSLDAHGTSATPLTATPTLLLQLIVKQAPDPSDVIHENLAVTSASR